MTNPTDVKTLARWMAGDFSNQEQAYANPPFFAHVRVCMRPLPYCFLDSFSLFLEQAYDFNLNSPYRLRVLQLQSVDGRIELINYKVKEEARFFGGSRKPEKLASLTSDDLQIMNGCDMIVEWTGKSFKGTVKPGKQCIVVRKERVTYLDNSFEIDPHRLISFDRGFDPETDELVWGSVAGPFEFSPTVSFADEVA
ncbi:MAG: Phycocyanobilin lyase CpcT [Chroococcopsis gigantea SAG 12.99]|jgi:hypothetical protein|nr:chromophore lyase CpcT/CpeT [Chlorogloea purpurea SAG 13.99]MDV2999806.1 Phycocyanobilin lyase CpcT [Chroococcopsis gigantea SAG 12.99]